MKKIIFNSFITLIALILLIVNILIPSAMLTTFTFFCWILAFIAWFYIFFTSMSSKRRHIFKVKMQNLNREDKKMKLLFTIYDYIEGEENNIELVQEVMEHIYFFPKKMYTNPEKVKKEVLFDTLIDYYLSLTHDRVKNGFFWDWNLNYFTWKWIGITFLISITGIITLTVFYHMVSAPDDVLFTALYFIFGVFLVPSLSKFFGHYI